MTWWIPWRRGVVVDLVVGCDAEQEIGNASRRGLRQCTDDKKVPKVGSPRVPHRAVDALTTVTVLVPLDLLGAAEQGSCVIPDHF